MRTSRRKRDYAYFFIILILVLVILYGGLRFWESTVLFGDSDGDKGASKDLIRDGVTYWPRQDITVVLVMGIDRTGPVEDSGSYTNSGMADMLTLLVFDESDKECDAVCFNRDTMVKLTELGIGGKPVGERIGQLALAHTYGNGLEESSQNTVKAVSDLLYGLKIDYYISLNMDAIKILNDSVGGVTVNVKDDFSAIDPSITRGEVKLSGEQAMTFVRTRHGLGDQLNVSRIERHKEYMTGFSRALRESFDEDVDFVFSTYDTVSPYIVTDCTPSVISSMMKKYDGYKVNEIIIPEGENVMGEEYMEFHLDEEKLDRLIISLFYAPKK